MDLLLNYALGVMKKWRARLQAIEKKIVDFPPKRLFILYVPHQVLLPK